jgi:peptidoglycan/xylan/chitin deacetylase (PgdA/CDA1 family)
MNRDMPLKHLGLSCMVVAILFSGCTSIVRKPIPDKLVVLTFDDASASHFAAVAPILQEFGFGASFYVTEFPPYFSDTTKFMTWPQIQALHEMGFEIGNHTRNHRNIATLTPEECLKEVAYIDEKFEAYGIDASTTFAYPGYTRDEATVKFMENYGYKFARIGENRPYNPESDHPMLVPSWCMGADNRDEIIAAMQEASKGNIVVLTIHGVPDTAHPFVSTPLALFKEHLQYLSDNGFTVIALRDLEKYVNVKNAMKQISYTKEEATFPR